MTVAALYVETDGAYFGLADVDPWDITRDARGYAGPFPVVAHPPCNRWSVLAACRGYRDGADGGCFAAALEAVRVYGGVLEHPAHTLAWERFALALPPLYGWARSLLDDGWTCRVDQRHYGHEARKPTWLYYVGTAAPPPLIWGRGPASALTIERSYGGGRQHLRSRTPAPFRDALLSLAAGARASVVEPAERWHR